MGSETVTCDERGRIVLPKELREQYGEKFIIVKVLREIVLIPVPKDPIKELQELGKKIPKHLSIKQIKEQARDLAVENILKEHADLKKKAKKRK